MSAFALFRIVRVAPAAVLAIAGASKLRRAPSGDEHRDDLFHAPTGTGLRCVARRDLRRLVRSGAPLDHVDLHRASLHHCDLSGRDLSGRDLRHADLRGARLEGTLLTGADLRFANLRHADLRGAFLAGARLLEADLGGADVRGADLSGARNLAMALLRDATADATTTWPAGFDAAAAGVRRMA